MATLAVTPAVGSDFKVTGLIAVTHFFSHLYILALPPIFSVLQADLGLSATQLGLTIAVLNVTTMLCQAPVGFLVDRVGPALILITGHAAFALATALAGLATGWPMLLALMVLAGLGNAVYHPADYTILAARISGGRVGRAFSIHTFGGYLGFAAAPLTVVPLTALFGWRVALMTIGAAGLALAVILVTQREFLRAPIKPARPRPVGTRPAGNLRLLASPPILLSLLFLVLLAAGHTGLVSFSPAALADLHGFDLVQANLPLTSYLIVSALGVLLGGIIADRTGRHALVVGGCSLAIALAALLVGLFDLGLAGLVLVFVLAGLAGGIIAPSRDMLVRAVTPEGASGKVFGFVMTGFNIGALLTPPVYGLLLDAGEPRLIFFIVAAFAALTLVTVVGAAHDRRPGR